MDSEIKFRKQIVKALRAAGFMVSVIEPNSGSTPGIPDLVISKGVTDLWLELKVADKHLSGDQVWRSCLRPAQRKWIKDRMAVAKKSFVSIYILVKIPKGIDLYVINPVHQVEWPLFREAYDTLSKIVDLLDARCL